MLISIISFRRYYIFKPREIDLLITLFDPLSKYRGYGCANYAFKLFDYQRSHLINSKIDSGDIQIFCALKFKKKH